VGSVLECLPQGSRVAVIRLRSLGDSVLTTPALDILKCGRPDLQLAIVVEDRFRAIFEGNPYLDRVLPPDLGAFRDWSPRLCLNLHGGSRSACMTALSGAPYRAGFAHFRHGFIYNVRIPRAQEILGVDRTVHTAEHLASAMFYLGVPTGEIPGAKLFAGQPERPATGAGDLRHGPYAVLHPFAATPQKTWRADGFLAIAEHLKQSGLEPVFIGGPGDDLSPFGAFRTIVNEPLSQTKQLLNAASLFVGNDSGPAHMAAAFGLPVVVIFGASDPAIWGPWRTVSEVVTAPGGISHVETAQVLDALARLRVHA
jgi:heptosyltransferase-3